MSGTDFYNGRYELGDITSKYSWVYAEEYTSVCEIKSITTRETMETALV